MSTSDLSAGQKAALTRKRNEEQAKWEEAVKQAAKTARWAVTMTRWAIRRATRGVKQWHVVDFFGPAGSESTGVVDLVAIRRDHLTAEGGVRPGDVFEIILVQVKGGSAPFAVPK